MLADIDRGGSLDLPSSGAGLDDLQERGRGVWSRLYTMETIQVVIGGGLLKAADQAARRLKVNRSALIRDAVREHLERLRYRELERQERDAYERIPDDPGEFAAWDKVASWPMR
jgi:Arc/MetJ-type ribon-helix-helix transcriptional regulator